LSAFQTFVNLTSSHHPLQVLPPVEALLDVTAHPEHDIFSMSFGFWHKLSRQLSMTSLQQQQEQQQQPGSPVQPAAAAATGAVAAEQQRRREFFRPAFEKLISMVRGRMRCVVGGASARQRAQVRYVLLVVCDHETQLSCIMLT
jgi:hypothetical protein